MTTAQQIFESHERFEKVKALAERGLREHIARKPELPPL